MKYLIVILKKIKCRVAIHFANGAEFHGSSPVGAHVSRNRNYLMLEPREDNRYTKNNLRAT